MKDLKGQKVIVRGDRSGVFIGTLVDRQGQEVEMKDARNIWYWDGANGLNEVATNGVNENSKITVAVDIILTDVIEILIPSDKAIKSIEGQREWKN